MSRDREQKVYTMRDTKVREEWKLERAHYKRPYPWNPLVPDGWVIRQPVSSRVDECGADNRAVPANALQCGRPRLLIV